MKSWSTGVLGFEPTTLLCHHSVIPVFSLAYFPPRVAFQLPPEPTLPSMTLPLTYPVY